MAEIPVLKDCWNAIGVWGDASCPELEGAIHCRNCPVYSTAATRLLNGTPPPGYFEEWTSLIAKEKENRESDTHSAVVFSIGSEWLALSTNAFKEISGPKSIHSLPHRRNGMVLGLVNIRGELLVCVSLAKALGLEATQEAGRDKKNLMHSRLLVINDRGNRLAFPVNEVGGIHHFSLKDVKDLPATITQAAATHLTGVLSWKNRSVGRLDEQLLFYTLNKGLA